MKRILCFGALNLDINFAVDHIVRDGETIAAQEVLYCCGGKGFNQAVALKRAGCRVEFAGKIGADGELLHQALIQENIDLQGLMMSEERNGSAYIQRDVFGQNSIILYGGTNRLIEKEEIEKVISSYEKGDIIVLQNEISNMPYLLECAKQKEMKIAFNPSPMEEWIKESDMKGITWLIINEVEGEQLSGKKESNEMMDYMVNRYPGLQIILTLGEEGAVYAKGDIRYRIPAYFVKTIDTTAAGDTYLGYLLCGLSEGKKMQEAMRLASAAAALAVTRKGAYSSIPFRREVEEFLESKKNDGR